MSLCPGHPQVDLQSRPEMPVGHLRFHRRKLMDSGQFIRTLPEVTPNGGLVGESPQKLPSLRLRMYYLLYIAQNVKLPNASAFPKKGSERDGHSP